jgi:hypothetical protein
VAFTCSEQIFAGCNRRGAVLTGIEKEKCKTCTTCRRTTSFKLDPKNSWIQAGGCIESIAGLQGDCTYRHADTVRGDRPTYEHLPMSRFRFIADPTSVEVDISEASYDAASLIHPALTRGHLPVQSERREDPGRDCHDQGGGDVPGRAVKVDRTLTPVWPGLVSAIEAN